MSNQDEEHRFGLEYCGRTMKNWRRSYCRKNSRRKVEFVLRWWWPADCPIEFSKRYIELHIKGKLVSQTRITPEAYDVLARDKPFSNLPHITFVLLETFDPTPQLKLLP